jgi:hypothetical protein
MGCLWQYTILAVPSKMIVKLILYLVDKLFFLGLFIIYSSL